MGALAVVLLLDLAVVAPERGDCAVASVAADARLEVRPDGAKPFSLTIEKLPLTASIRGDGTLDVAVRGRLVFRGAAPRGAIGFRLRRPVELSNGRGVLGEDLLAARPVARGDVARGALTVDGQYVEIRGIEVPCGALAVDTIHEKIGFDRDDGEAPRYLRDLVPRGRALRFRDAPGGPVAFTMALTDDKGMPSALRVGEVGAKGGWLAVEWRSYGGTRLRGFVRASEVEEESGLGLSGFGTSSHCRGACDRGVGIGRNTYRGKATVRAGAKVFAGPAVGKWAEVATGGEYDVIWERGAPWVQIESVPGIEESCGALDHAWVAIADVVIP